MTKAEMSETVLIVDTDALQRSLVSEYLRACGYHVLEAATAEEALAALAEVDAGILVVDANLRDASGFELSIKARGIRPALECILTRSPERTAKIADRLCEDGPLDHPYHPQQLVERIKRLRER